MRTSSRDFPHTSNAARSWRDSNGRRNLADGQVQRTCNQVLLGDLRPDKFLLDPAFVKHEHAIATADQLVIVGRIKNDRGAFVGEAPQQLIYLLLGADVDAARRIAEEQDSRLP